MNTMTSLQFEAPDIGPYTTDREESFSGTTNVLGGGDVPAHEKGLMLGYIKEAALLTPTDLSFSYQRDELLPRAKLVPQVDHGSGTLESIGYLESQLLDIEEMTRGPSGSVWWGGGTGSGNRTSLAIASAPVRNAITRPDVRDKAAADSALDLVMNGHLVLTTIYVDRFVDIPSRLVTLGASRSLVMNHYLITGLINQSLVRILCPECKRPLQDNRAHVESATLKRLDHLASIDSSIDLDAIYIAAPRGSVCKACGGCGTSGQKVVAEVCIPDASLMTFLRNDDPIGALRYFALEMKCITKLAHAFTYMRAGELDPAQIEHVVSPVDEDIRDLGLTA